MHLHHRQQQGSHRMKQPNTFVRLAAVVNSLLLVGGFVSYRAGAFDSLLRFGAKAADSESSPKPEETPPEQSQSNTLHFEGRIDGTVDRLMSSSKSFTLGTSLFKVPEAQLPSPSQPTPTTKQPTPTIMSGSKAPIHLVFPAKAEAEAIEVHLPGILPHPIRLTTYRPPETPPPATSSPSKPAP
jgi:hypothetical protein